MYAIKVNSLTDNEYREWSPASSRRKRSLGPDLKAIDDVIDKDTLAIVGEGNKIHQPHHYARLVPVGRFRREVALSQPTKFKVNVDVQRDDSGA